MTVQKYRSDNGPSALEISRSLHDAHFSEDDIHMFYVALIINFLLAGTDAHAKGACRRSAHTGAAL